MVAFSYGKPVSTFPENAPCRPCRRQAQRSGEALRHAQRVRGLRRAGPWQRRACARPQAAARPAEPGASSRAARPWARGAGDPRALARGHASRAGGKHQRRHPRHRDARAHPRRRACHPRAQRTLPDRIAGRPLPRLVPGERRQRRAKGGGAGHAGDRQPGRFRRHQYLWPGGLRARYRGPPRGASPPCPSRRSFR